MPDSDSYTNSYSDSYEIYKGYTGTDSNGDSFDDSFAGMEIITKLPHQ